MQQTMMTAHVTSKQLYLYKLTQQLCLQARTRIFPGKQLDSVQQRPEEASVEPRHVHASIANPTRNINLDTR